MAHVVIDRVNVGLGDASNKHHRDVVLDGPGLGVVYARLLAEYFCVVGGDHHDRVVAEGRLFEQLSRFGALRVHDAVLKRLNAVFVATLFAVSEDGQAGAVTGVVSGNDKAARFAEDGVVAGHDGGASRIAPGLGPVDLEDLSVLKR